MFLFFILLDAILVVPKEITVRVAIMVCRSLQTLHVSNSFFLKTNKREKDQLILFLQCCCCLPSDQLNSHLWARCLMRLNKQTKHNCVFKKWNYLILVLLFFLLVFRLIFFPFHFFYCHVAGIFPHLPYSDLSQALRWPFSSPVPGVLLTAVN